MTVKNQQNKTVMRCDSRCYNAIGTECLCICNGKNHGVGLAKALENIQDETLISQAELTCGTQYKLLVANINKIKP